MRLPLTLIDRGTAFRAALDPADVSQLVVAQTLFHGSWLLPLILYAALEPRPRLLPMSISWTIRRGIPRLVHHCCYVAGWLLLLATCRRAVGNDGLVTYFALQMFATGVFASIVCPLGSGRRVQDAVHWLAAFIYIADHVFLFAFLGVQGHFVTAFWTCLCLMAVSAPGTSSDAARAAAGDGIRVENTLAEWTFMLSEYGLFVTSTCGMLSGIAEGSTVGLGWWS